MFKVSAVHVEVGLSTPWNSCHRPRRSTAGSTEVQAACRRATSICVVTMFGYTSSLKWLHKKSNGVRSGERGGHRT
ncbi:uncharacterized protein TNCV_1314321 [Trichonephila clavipes]|nr:uncharacterized protein TNCV_1314321 [Trichonephila clavipes]